MHWQIYQCNDDLKSLYLILHIGVKIDQTDINIRIRIFELPCCPRAFTPPGDHPSVRPLIAYAATSVSDGVMLMDNSYQRGH